MWALRIQPWMLQLPVVQIEFMVFAFDNLLQALIVGNNRKKMYIDMCN